MAILPDRAVAGDPAQVLATNDIAQSEGDYRARTVVLQNVTGDDVVFLGDEGVTGATGFRWDVAELGRAFEVTLEPGESVYGFAASDQEIHVLAGGR